MGFQHRYSSRMANVSEGRRLAMSVQEPSVWVSPLTDKTVRMLVAPVQMGETIGDRRQAVRQRHLVPPCVARVHGIVCFGLTMGVWY